MVANGPSHGKRNNRTTARLPPRTGKTGNTAARVLVQAPKRKLIQQRPLHTLPLPCSGGDTR
eukprot:4368874-Lingulodinium_polyedra.AAC.1